MILLFASCSSMSTIDMHNVLYALILLLKGLCDSAQFLIRRTQLPLHIITFYLCKVWNSLSRCQQTVRISNHIVTNHTYKIYLSFPISRENYIYPVADLKRQWHVGASIESEICSNPSCCPITDFDFSKYQIV